MKQIILIPGFLLAFCVALAAAPQSTGAQPTRLVTAKIVHVDSMPDNLDQWLIMDLRAWGKYQVSGNAQGVDLVIRAKKAERKSRYVVRNMQVQKKQAKTPPVLSVTVVDWVTGAKLWQADILNASQKKNENPPPGPDTEIYARHMTPDQIAQRCATLLRKYVTQLEESGGRK